jgi:uncharacterized protein YjbI with pentapeptide repeats
MDWTSWQNAWRAQHVRSHVSESWANIRIFWHNRWRPTLLIAFAVAVAVVTLVLLPPLLVPDSGLTVESRARLEFEERRTAIAALVAIGGAISLLYTHRRHELDRDANRTGRFTSAVEQLGHESLDVRLGGISALERIAQDSLRDRTVIFEVLSTFVRLHASAVQRAPDGVVELPLPIGAALNVLARRPLDGSYPTPDLTRIDLSGTNLRAVDLQGMNLAEAQLAGCVLEGVRLADADLTRADLSGASGAMVDFSGSDLSGANLATAVLPRADFRGAVLTGTILRSSNLTGSDLSGASLEGADMSRATLVEAVLDEAALESATTTDMYR